MTLCLCGCGQEANCNTGYSFGHWNEESKKYQKFQEEYPFDLDVLFGEDLKKLGLKI